MRDVKKSDNRVTGILANLERYLAGDFTNHLAISDASDEIDSVIAGLNKLGHACLIREEAIKKKEERINSLLEVLLKYTRMDFSKKAELSDDEDEIDALGAGLNALGEEVLYHTAKLKDSEEQIKTIFQHAPDAVIVIDSQGRTVRWNPVARRIFGWEEDEVRGKLLHEILIPERFRQQHVAGMTNFLKTGEGAGLNKTVALPALCKNGAEIEIELTISPAKVNDEYVFISFLRDIRERKKAEDQIRQLNATLEQRVLERTEELNVSEKKYRNLFENNPMPLWVLDMDLLTFMDVNESALSHYGYSREEFLSMTALELRPEEERPRYTSLLRSTRGTQNTGIWKHRKKDGTIIHSEVTVHEILFEGRQARLVLANDVTETTKALEALKRSEERFRRIFDSKLMGFSFGDFAGNITEANDLFLEMTGYTRKDLAEGKILWKEMTPPAYAELDNLALAQIRLGGVCDPYEKEFIRKDGSRLPIIMGAAVIDDGLSLGVACILDISQRKMMEQEIQALNRNLEARIHERTAELEEVNKELESFSYSVSHDLRAPLRAIHGYSQMLMEDHEHNLDREGIRLLNAVKFNAKRMGQLVDDLLAFSRMGKRAMTENHTDISRLVDEVLEGFSDEQKVRTKITVHEMGIAKVDGTLMGLAFQNLISNALKYSFNKVNPHIEIGLTQINGQPTFFVRDNGAGFDMAYYNKLFGVFNRLHTHAEFEGNGVGLAIVQRIIHRHGGKIWAEGKVGEGAVFYFTVGPHG